MASRFSFYFNLLRLLLNNNIFRRFLNQNLKNLLNFQNNINLTTLEEIIIFSLFSTRIAH